MTSPRRGPALILAVLAASPALAAPAIEGVWRTQDGDARVRIAPCAADPAGLCGVIVGLKDPNGPDGLPAHDFRNRDPALKDRPLIGLPLMRDMRAAAAGRWAGGRIYDPNSGRTYDARLTLRPDGALRVDGCVLMLCEGETWTRLPD